MQTTRRGPTAARRAPRGGTRVASLLTATFIAGLAFVAGEAIAAEAPVGLGTADSFAVLAGASVTNTGPSVIDGDLGVTPGAAVSGFPPGVVTGTIHAADAVALQAQNDLTTAYNDAAGRAPTANIAGDLGGLTLVPGVYNAASSIGLTGTLTLDAQGDPDAVFVFEIGSTLITASNSRVELINGAQACNVFWQVGSSATLGTSSVFAGNVLALTSITMDDGVTMSGRALARNGTVSLINDTITAAQCATPVTPGTPAAPATPATPGAPATPGPVAPGTPLTPGTPRAGGGTAFLRITPRSLARKVARFGTTRCVPGVFRASVTGRSIRRVVFSLGGRVVATRGTSPFVARVKAPRGVRIVVARVTFRDATRPTTLRMRLRVCADVGRDTAVSPSLPPRVPGGFTG